MTTAVHCRAFADSKTLTEEKRESLFAEIQADAELGFEVDSISASRISTDMLRRSAWGMGNPSQSDSRQLPG